MSTRKVLAASLLLAAVQLATSTPVTATPPPPAPFTPAGGLGTNGTPPVYSPMSDFDFQSMNLALNQEWIELDLFHHGVAQFAVEEFEAAGIDAEDRFLIEFMADQEVGHATMLTNIWAVTTAAKSCNYTYPFTTVREFVDFCQKLTRFGESGHLDSRPSAELLLQSITTEARQQMIFRQFEGLFPIARITQSMAWTLLSPYIVSCPAENPHIVFQNFPALNIVLGRHSTLPAITHNRSIPLSTPRPPSRPDMGTAWEDYRATMIRTDNHFLPRDPRRRVIFTSSAWISQLNTTYTPLFNINGTSGFDAPAEWDDLRAREQCVGQRHCVCLLYSPALLPTRIALTVTCAGPAMYMAG
ncbi:Rds1 protein [Mycena olivaceomarginata]|nr:Rds1 protein [Mycena olivaceomarginata]